MRPNRTGNFSCEPRASTVERPAENTCSAPSSSTGCNGYSSALGAIDSESATRPDDSPSAAESSRTERNVFAVSQSQIAHVAVERVDIDWLEFRDNRPDFSVET